MAMTAYEEALRNIQAGKETGIPSYMVAADTLSIANGNKTFAESAVDTVQGIRRFIGLSVISGANQLYNIPSDIGNLFGGNFGRVETEDVVANLDSDLSQFYKEHQESVDLVGFLVSSLAPGTAGIKILNAGQKGLRGAMGAGRLGARHQGPRAAPSRVTRSNHGSNRAAYSTCSRPSRIRRFLQLRTVRFRGRRSGS